MASSRIAHLRDAETAGRKYSRDPPVSHSRVLHLDTLDVNVPPDLEALACTEHTAWKSSCNSYYPSLGSRHLREVVTRHVSIISGCCYTPDESCIITSGGSSSGLLDILISTVGQGDEVILLDPTYREHFNRVLLTGAKPILAPFQFNPGKEWTFDAQTLRELITAKTRVMLLMSPSFPCGGYLTELDWQCVAQLCLQHDLILIVDSSMERLVFDSRPLLHPAGLPGMAERTITLGSASKELRMIGWRVGWIVGPAKLITKISAICQTNTMAPAGIVQEPVALALERSSMTLPSYVEALQARRDLLLSQLRGLSVGIPSGGWGLFLRVSDFGRTSEDAYADLLNAGVLVNVGDWICNTNQYVCLIFSNVALQDLEGIGKKIRTALNVTTEE